MTTLLIIVWGKLWEMSCFKWDICLYENSQSLYSYTSLHSVDQKELFLTAKKIGKDLSVILKHETFQRSILSLENFHYKDVLKDITS